MPPQRGLVEHVVVNQRGRVDQLGGHGQGDVLRPEAAAGLGRQQHQRRPDTLPAQPETVLGQPVDERVIAGKFLLQQPAGPLRARPPRARKRAEILRNRQVAFARRSHHRPSA